MMKSGLPFRGARSSVAHPSIAIALCTVFAAACGETPVQTGSSSTSSESTSTGGSTAGSGGSTGGSGGMVAGSGGMTAGSGGMAAGSGGMTAGSGGMVAGSGGAMMGSGGAMAGSGGMVAGSGGAMMGSGGSGGTAVSPPSNCALDAGAPEILVTGDPAKVLLKGCIVTPDVTFDGEVLVEGDTLTCVGPSCSAEPGAATATVVATHGIVLPGLIDVHNHILFDIFDEDDWSPSQSYTNHKQWTAEARYGAMVDAKQYMNGEGVPNIDPGFGCEMDKYGELKGLIAGTTSIVGAANPTNKTCYGSLARTIDQTPNDLGQDKIQVATLFPPSSPDTICANFAADKTDSLVVHCGEGVDDVALAELDKLGTITSTVGCLYAPETTIVHGAAFGDAEFTTMATNSMSLVWSPRSNVFLYGGGVDLTKTANIPLALSKGINIALGPDWSLGGSQNMLDEMRFADQVDNGVWGNQLSAKDIVTMATKNGAQAIGLLPVLGTLEVGKKADLFVIGGDQTAPWDAVLASTPADVRLVMVGGVSLYGDTVLGPLGPASPGCEALDVCAVSKFVCVAENGGNATNKFGQTLAEITTILSTELSAYDAMDLSPWDFAPIPPLVKCP